MNLGLQTSPKPESMEVPRRATVRESVLEAKSEVSRESHGCDRHTHPESGKEGRSSQLLLPWTSLYLTHP